MKRLIFFSTLLLFTCLSYCLKPCKDYQIKPEQYGLIYKEIPVTTKDGYHIECFFFPAQEAKQITHEMYYKPQRLPYESYPPNKTIIIANGDGGNMMNMLSYIYKLVTKGMNVVSFDWRGFGESDAWETNPDLLCYTEYIWDYDAVINKISQLTEVDGIGVFGVSTGAYLSFAVAYQNKNVDCFVGRALMTDFEEVILNLHKLNPDRKLSYPRTYPKNLLPINLSRTFNKPVLLIVGENDLRTPVEMSQRIYDNLKGTKELWIVENAGHGGENAPETVSTKLFWEKVISFFQNHID